MVYSHVDETKTIEKSSKVHFFVNVRDDIEKKYFF